VSCSLLDCLKEIKNAGFVEILPTLNVDHFLKTQSYRKSGDKSPSVRA
jgi:hypothetical protein